MSDFLRQINDLHYIAEKEEANGNGVLMAILNGGLEDIWNNIFKEMYLSKVDGLDDVYYDYNDYKERDK